MVIIVICTNLANELGPHRVGTYTTYWGLLDWPLGLGKRFQPTNVFHEMEKRGIWNGSDDKKGIVWK